MAWEDSLLAQGLRSPASSVVILGLGIVHLLVHFHWFVGLDRLAFRFTSAVEDGEHWRSITSQLTHFNLLHLAFNVSSLFNMAPVEQAIGSIEYIRITLLLLMFSYIFQVVIYDVLIGVFHKEQYRFVQAVGYSCVVFGWMTVASVWNPSSSLSVFGLFQVPVTLAPFGSLIFTQVLIRQASFWGHFAGIVAGYLLGSGLWERFSDVASSWAVIAVFFLWVASTAKKTPR